MQMVQVTVRPRPAACLRSGSWLSLACAGRSPVSEEWGTHSCCPQAAQLSGKQAAHR